MTRGWRELRCSLGACGRRLLWVALWVGGIAQCRGWIVPRSVVALAVSPMHAEKKPFPQPSRHDDCLVLASGVVGAAPRELFLYDDHYMISFPIAVVGHFTAVREREGHCPAETQWVNCEAWDSVAKRLGAVKKGDRVALAGVLVQSKWLDPSGDQRSALRLRVSSLLSTEQAAALRGAFDTTE